MDLSNEFVVEVPIDRAWAILTDVETIAPCLPGAQLQEVDGEEYLGIVKVKVGPITATYKGKATFVEKDEAGRRAVIRADGRETRGQGNASALITAEMVPAGPSSTGVRVSTDLTVTGRVAQFGRGVMADVSAKLMDQFAENLSSTVLQPADEPGGEAPAADPEGPGPTAEQAPSSAPAPGPRPLPPAEPVPIDLLDTAATPVLKRLLPAMASGVVLWVVIRMLVRRCRR